MGWKGKGKIMDWKEKLKQHLDYCLNWCERTGNEACIHQAFGAVQFAIFEHPESDGAISKMWADFKPRFERRIWGMGLSI